MTTYILSGLSAIADVDVPSRLQDAVDVIRFEVSSTERAAGRIGFRMVIFIMLFAIGAVIKAAIGGGAKAAPSQQPNYRAAIAEVCRKNNVPDATFDLRARTAAIVDGRAPVHIPSGGYWIIKGCSIAGFPQLTRRLEEYPVYGSAQMQAEFDDLFDWEIAGLPISVNPATVRIKSQMPGMPMGVIYADAPRRLRPFSLWVAAISASAIKSTRGG